MTGKLKNFLDKIAVGAIVAIPLVFATLMIIFGSVGDDGRYSLTGEKTSTPDFYNQMYCELDQQVKNANADLLGVNVAQDNGNGCEATDAAHDPAQMGSIPYYKVDVSSPTAFYKAVNGKSFNEGYGIQCVAGFKEFMFALSGKYVATSTGGASGYANQQSQIQPLGFTWHSGSTGLRDGDWGIFNIGVYGHVAMYYHGQWFGQNQNATNANIGSPFNLQSLGIDPVGYYRPNIYKNLNSELNSKPVDKPATTTTGNNKPVSDAVAPTGAYVVQSGDTLGQIILDNGWRDISLPLFGDDGQAQSLANRNGIQNRGLIFPKQVIKKE